MKNIPIGLLRRAMHEKGKHGVVEVSEAYFLKQKELEKGNEWYYDATLLGGSDHACHVVNNFQVSEMSIWSINHYLGLNRESDVINAGLKSLFSHGTGSGTSAMSGGHCELHKQIQDKFSKIFNKEESLLYSTGFTANLGAISGLMGGSKTHNLIIIDQECHASIIDGCKLSGATFIRFKHNDVSDLKYKIEKYKDKYSNIMVAIESIYSMSGDIAPIKEICNLKEHIPFILFVDESHSFGIYGEKGRGICFELGVLDKVDIIMTTLSKSCASIGGIISTSRKFCSILRWSTSYIYQASIPPHCAAIVLAALEQISQGYLVDELNSKVAYFRTMLDANGFKTGGYGAIVPIYVEDEKLKRFEKELFRRGIYTVAIQYPIVALGEARFRFIINASHTFQEIDNLLLNLNDIRDNINQI